MSVMKNLKDVRGVFLNVYERKSDAKGETRWIYTPRGLLHAKLEVDLVGPKYSLPDNRGQYTSYLVQACV